MIRTNVVITVQDRFAMRHTITRSRSFHLSTDRRVMFLIWAVLVGSRAQYGIAKGQKAVRSLLALHRARSQVRGSVMHCDKFRFADRRSITTDVVPALSGLGELKIGLMIVDDEAIAAQMWLEKCGAMFLYYSGYLPGWAKYSVGMVATIETLKVATARGLHTVDFLIGMGQDKSRWRTERSQYRNMLLARRPRIFMPVLALRALARVPDALRSA